LDIKQYIESGILENYVLGGATSQEIREVECLSTIYPEIKTELFSLQESMENYVQTLSVSPSPEIKERIMMQIDKLSNLSEESETSTLRVEKEPNDNISQSISKFYKYGLAASVLLAVCLFAYQFKLQNTLNRNYAELAELRDLNETNSGKTNGLLESIEKIKQREKLLASASSNSINLAGTDVSPESKVRVVWNKSTAQIVIIQDELPKPSADKQYQLWGLVDGAPVSLGTLDKSELISEVRNISLDKVDAFAITLEKDGGSETPNLEQLYVIGNT